MANKKTVKTTPIVVLNEVYQVALDPKCFILQKKISNDDQDLSKEEKTNGMKNMGYYSTWEHLGGSLIDDIVREKAFKINKEQKLTIQEFLKVVEESHAEVENMFKKIDDKRKITKK